MSRDHPMNDTPERLRRLAAERIDLFQLHRIDPEVLADEQSGLLGDLLEEGKVRAVGLSEVSVEELEAARRVVPVSTVQNLYNLVNRKSEAVLDHCEREGIGFIPWFPIAAGDLARPRGGDGLAERGAVRLPGSGPVARRRSSSSPAPAPRRVRRAREKGHDRGFRRGIRYPVPRLSAVSQRANCSVTFVKVSSVAVLISRSNRRVDTARTASHMAQLARLSPPSSTTGTWCGNPRSRVVKGTTMACRIGSVLKRSPETTRHGRKPRCSLATVGSSGANQMWPCCTLTRCTPATPQRQKRPARRR